MTTTTSTTDDTLLVKPLPRRGANAWLGRLLIFATLVVLVDALFGERGLAETMRARREFARAEASIDALRDENRALRGRIGQLRDDPRAIEAEARRELGLIKPGELLFVIRDASRP